jgi:hypothetical protein
MTTSGHRFEADLSKQLTALIEQVTGNSRQMAVNSEQLTAK